MKEWFLNVTRKNIYVFTGIIILLLCYIFYMIKGVDLVVTLHDELDSEVVFYVLKSASFESLLSGSFPQYMDGHASIVLPSFATTFFYMVLPPVYAFISNLFFVRIVAFLSLFYLLKEYGVEKQICLPVALVFAALPIYSVYGLSSMGVSLVWLSVIRIRQGKKVEGFLGIALYGLFSSLVLVGFAVLLFFAIYILIAMIKRWENIRWLVVGFGELICIYMLTNVELLGAIFTSENSFVSHKTDYVLKSSEFKKEFIELLRDGQYHAASHHKGIIYIGIIVVVLIIIFGKKISKDKELKRRCFNMILVGVVIIGIISFSSLFLSGFGTKIRNVLFSGSALIAAQFNRVHWLGPVLWYMLYGLILSVFYNIIKQFWGKRIGVVLVAALCVVPLKYTVPASDITRNLKDSFIEPIEKYSWEMVYAEEIFSQIEEYIGKETNSYQVVSVGLHPAIAVYNGFYSLDGYSNNYDLAYKKEFGEVIKAELEKSPSNSASFYDWGNRCYMLSAELGNNHMVKKDTVDSIELDINIDKLREMGGDYIFSAVKINNADKLGINFKKYFDSEDSYYGIYLYEIGD